MKHFSPLLSALISILLIFILIYSKAGKSIQDVPNERSLHSSPVPRIGGVGLMAGLLSGWAMMFRELSCWVVVPLIILFAVSLLDDVQGLPVRKRFSAHTVAAILLVSGTGLWGQNIALGLLVLFFTVWMTNLYNFMDGSDGLAGGMAFFGFTIYGIASLMNHNEIHAMLNFCIGAAALGFLYHNFAPARVFMGDAGSIPLGFLAVAMGVQGWQSGAWAFWFPLLVFSPFIVDASVTLMRRLWRQVKVTEAHREHYYQRAIQMGFSHRDVALIEYILMLGVGVSALWSLEQALPWQAFLAWCIIYGALMWAIDSRWKKFNRVAP